MTQDNCNKKKAERTYPCGCPIEPWVEGPASLLTVALVTRGICTHVKHRTICEHEYKRLLGVSNWDI